VWSVEDMDLTDISEYLKRIQKQSIKDEAKLTSIKRSIRKR